MTVLAVATVAALAMSGCSAAKVLETSSGTSGSPTSSPTPKVPQVAIHMNVRRHATRVAVDQKIKVSSTNGELQQVTLTGPGGTVPGKLATNSQVWKASGLLRADSKYVVRGLAVDNEGLRKHFTRKFHTRKLTLDQQTYPSFVPTAGSTVGIAMPVIIRFDVPVTDKASIERHLSVVSQPAQAGAFHWISDNEVHWRPKTYWKPGTAVTVKADIGSVPAGNGIYGQLDREETFHIGRGQITKVNVAEHELRVFRSGKLIRTIPVTSGAEPKYTTRSGIKVIVEKDRRHDMNSETIGIDPNSADGYNLKGVEYAMRLTYSGEFLHAAPWSVASQGHVNVSHGCTGMSTSNAGWLYNHTLIGDPVEFSGTNRQMTLTNGYGDWNESFAQYKQGSALS
ncbi:L,D-transpeptidase [Nocardioides terrisoli]|uniref:L,D-transpeptidase n=1 Tax=Nocardioides terrisoli TaxID=3388267 RepID=UPI00287B7BEC|nr:Ig-like domain-containing protein [Nocardioides marmorisolisilvae]